MQKKCLKFVFLVLLLCNTSLIFSHDATKSVVKIGYVPNYGVIADPYVVGKEGFGFEIFKEISRYSDYTFEFVPVLWKDVFSLLDSGEIDIFGPVSYSKTRAESYIYSTNPFGHEKLQLVALKDSDYYYKDYEGFDNCVIGTLENNVHVPTLEKYLQENNIDAEIVYNDTNTFVDNLRNGICDIALATSLETTKELKILDVLGTEPFYFIGSKENQEVIEDIDRINKKLQEENSIFFESLYIKYFVNDANLAQNALSKSEIELLQRKDIYSVGYNPNYKPLSYQDQIGMPKGTAIEVMNEVAKIANIAIEYIPLDENSASDKTLDFNLDALGNNLQKEDFSTVPYMDISLVAIINKKSTNKIYKTLGMLNYNSIDLTTIEDLYPNTIILETKSMDENIELLQTNTIDGIIVSSLVANSLFDSVYLDKYSMQFLGITVPFVITMSNDLPLEVQDIIDKIIEGLDSNFIQGIISSNVALLDDGKISLAEFFYKYRIRLTFSLLLVAIFFIGIIIIITKKKQEELLIIRNVDDLTKLMTISKFFTEAGKVLKNASPNEYMLYSVDIDNFKQINKLNGYDFGNKVLVEFAKVIRKKFGEDSLIAREINDIFIILAKHTHNTNTVCEKNDDCEVCSAYNYKNIFSNNYTLSTSEGIYIVENPSEDIGFMLDCSHTARLEGKQTFGKTTHIFTEEMLRRQFTKNTIESLMESALKNDEFFVVLQPKHGLLSGNLIGAEALIRWKPKSGKTIYPDEFISIFETNGFIKKIDFFILEKVCQLIQQQENDFPTISVNLSGVTAIIDNLAEQYLAILDRYEVQPSQIEIELTESAFVMNSKKVRHNLEELKNSGFGLSIDDFGIGFSSLSRLKDMNVDELKLDRSFIASNLISDRGIAILKNVISLSKDLHLNVVAEGIETEEQMNVLLSLGCDIGQGYFFAKPMEIDDFLNIYKNNTIVNEFDYEKISKTGKLLKKIEDSNKFNSGVLICKNDQYFSIISANDEAYKILGYSRQEMNSLYRNRFLNLIQGDTYGYYHTIKNIIKSNQNLIHIEYKIKRKKDSLLIRNFIMYDTVNDVFTFSIIDNSVNAQQFDMENNLSNICSLTNIYNLYGIEQKYNELHTNHSNNCLFLVNVSGIGAVNKKYSEEEGDSVLQHFAQILQSEFEDADILGRLEGNKFIVYYNGSVEKSNIESYVDRLIQKLNLVHEDIPIFCYIGIGYDNAGTKSFNDLCDLAQKALRIAKQDVQNSYRIKE